MLIEGIHAWEIPGQTPKSRIAMQTSIEQIEPIVKEVARDLRLQQVILFGSLARGTQSERSDIDLIVVRETSSISPRR